MIDLLNCPNMGDSDYDGPKSLKNCCCCNCRNRTPYYSHPCVDDKPISHQNGWLCMAYVNGVGRPTLCNEHGVCELHDRIIKEGYILCSKCGHCYGDEHPKCPHCRHVEESNYE